MFDSTDRAHGAALVIFASLAVVATSGPVAAATTSCNIPQPCALFANANGPGVSGTSAKSEGVVGTTTFAATSTSNRTFGVEGIDGSTNKNAYNFGIYGMSPYGTGVAGFSASGMAVNGTSSSGVGVRAASSSGIALNASSSTNYSVSGTSAANTAIVGTTSASTTSAVHDGVMGVDTSTSGGSNNGVYGMTTNGGFGVEGSGGNGASGGVGGFAINGIGVDGQSESSIGTYGYSNGYVGVYGNGGPGGTGVYGTGLHGTGVQGVSSSSYGLYGSSSSGIGIGAASSTGNGLEITSGGGGSGVGMHIASTGNATDVSGSYIALLGRSNAFPLVLTNNASTDLFYVDGAGNTYTHGTYKTFVATRSGVATTAFTARTTTQTVEDAGTARVVNGSATVRFDPAFAASIDANAIYQVFLTPGGDTHGLFVATKTPAGFVVRETEGGHATLAFDYRIVATAPGHARERMAFVSADSAPHAPPSARVMKLLPALAGPTSAKAASHVR